MKRADERMTSAEEISRQAAEWVMRIDLGGTPEEWARLDAWLATNPRHRAAFLRLSVAWRRADTLRRVGESLGDVDPDLLAPTRVSHTDFALPPSFATPKRPRHLAVATAAAVLCFIAVIASYFILTSPTTYSTAVGELRVIALPDGSVMTLNTATRVRVRFTDDERRIELVRGEALFKISRDARRPFDVSANAALVRAVGTEFSVRVRESASVEILVVAGTVAINPPAGATLEKQAFASVRQGVTSVQLLSPIDVEDRLAWTSGKITLKGETVAAVVSEFNRYNTRQIVLKDGAVADQRIGGTYALTDPEGFAANLTRVFPLRLSYAEDSDGNTTIVLQERSP